MEIDAFLDAADLVLNSNTFLVGLPLLLGDPVADVEAFIRNGGLQEALFAADIARGWMNLHRFSPGDILCPLPGNFVRHDFRLKRRDSRYDASDYLQGMLRANPLVGNFTSFYRKALSFEVARSLTLSLLTRLFPAGDPSLIVFEPDFMGGDSPDAEEAYYFEGKGCDNAALLASGGLGYLLLTNGAP